MIFKRFFEDNWKEYLGSSIVGSIGGMFIIFVQNSKNNVSGTGNVFLAIPISFLFCFILGFLVYALTTKSE